MTNKHAFVACVADEAVTLPGRARTRSGVEFNPNDATWCYRDQTETISLDFTSLPISGPLLKSAKLALLWYAEQLSASHLKNSFSRLLHFVRYLDRNSDCPVNEITGWGLINYRSSLNRRTSWYLGSLAGLLRKWTELRYPGVSADALVLLDQLRIEGNMKGEAVLTHDPFEGPFTDIELSSLHAALDRAHAEGSVEREAYLLAYLYMLLGQRSVQYAALKVCDVSMVRAQDGTSVYMLRVPRAKQRNQLARTEFKHRALIPRVGSLLVSHANEIRELYRYRLSDPTQAPLFPARRRTANEPLGFEFHRTRDSLTAFLKNSLKSLTVKSERTGQLLGINPTRFRRTVATRAAVEGHGELIIAELLDHTDTQNVGVYIEARPELIDRIDRAVAMRLAPMAQAFVGMLIRDESEATRAGDPDSRICDPRFDESMKPAGSCGKHGFCGLMAPTACYTCVSFQPWLDGPHEAVLAHLISERERLHSSRDLRIASINDRTILAVAEVVRLCEQQGGGYE